MMNFSGFMDEDDEFSGLDDDNVFFHIIERN